MSNQKNRKRNRRTSKKKVTTPDFGPAKTDLDFGPAKIDREPNPSFSSEVKKLETAAKALSPANTGSAASAGKAGKMLGTMLRKSFKEGGMVGRATGQGYGAARKGPNVV